MTEQNSHEIDNAGIHYEKLRFLLTNVNNPKLTIYEFNREASEHIDFINNSDNIRRYIGFYFRQRMIPEWDHEQPSDYIRQLSYYRIEENSAEFIGRIPQTTIMRRLEGVEARPVMLGRALAYFFTPENNAETNVILSSPRKFMEIPAIPDMTLYQILI